MADFLISYRITLAHEGGYANHPNDRGGETYKGIARRFHPTWSGWRVIDRMKQNPGFPGNLSRVTTELEPHVQSFYRAEFWNRMRLGELQNQHIANELFDTGVNMGIAAAISDLQRSINILSRNGRSYPMLKVDGLIGPITIGATNRHPHPSRIFNCLNGYQFGRYVAICERNPSQMEFFNGWLTRVEIM